MNTYGWDIVYGCSKRVVNKHLEDYITKNKVEFLYSNTAKKQEIKMVLIIGKLLMEDHQTF